MTQGSFETGRPKRVVSAHFISGTTVGAATAGGNERRTVAPKLLNDNKDEKEGNIVTVVVDLGL